MKKVVKILSILFIAVILIACENNNNKDAIKFKEDYEKLNGVETKKAGVDYRTITIDEDNPFIYANITDVVNMIMNKETFFVYFGANWCPWCRSVLPTVIEEAHNAGIKKIYYVDVRPNNDEDKDIRDIYSLDDNGKIYLSHKGEEDYKYFLMYADKVLSTYNSHGVKVDDVKRVGAPNFFFIEDGVVTTMTTGISEHQTDGYMDITAEMKEDMSNLFKDYFNQMK